MQDIAADFDVWKALTALRTSETESYNDVLRKVLKLPPAQSPPVGAESATAPGAKPWVSKGVAFPEGTKLSALYKGTAHTAQVTQGGLKVDGFGPANSLSAAARLITGNSVDGWTFWEVKRPGDSIWRKAGALRGP